MRLLYWIRDKYRRYWVIYYAMDAWAEREWFSSENDNVYFAAGAIFWLWFAGLCGDHECLFYLKETVENYWSFKHYCLPFTLDPNSYYHPWFTWDPFIMDGEMAWEPWWRFEST